MTLGQRILNVLESFDMFAFCVLSLGGAYPGETISGASYRAEVKGTFMRHFRAPIDWLFRVLFGQDNHCLKAYLYAVNKGNLPEDMR